MVRLNSPDARVPTLMGAASRTVAGQFIETEGTALGTWTFDVFIPAYAIIQDIGILNEVVWGATVAAITVGDYGFIAATGLIDTGTEIDADGFYVDLLVHAAADITAGQSVNFKHINDASEGAYLPANLAPQTVIGDGLIASVDRWLRFSLLTTSAVGTAAGITYMYVTYALPEMDATSWVAT